MSQSRRALISVSDKTGLVELAQALTEQRFEIVTTGGTAKTLAQAEITHTEVSDYTGFPEMMGGRLKTLHPKIFGGILYKREDPSHRGDADRHDLPSIDWVVVNLYPFERIHMENKIPRSEMIEFIDIGGPSLLRAAAKNCADVVAVCDPKDYPRLVQELKETGGISARTRIELAGKVYAHTAHYDSMIAKFFRRGGPVDKPRVEQAETEFPEEFTIGLRKVSDLRYGENPQQKAALYKESGDREWGVVNAEKLQGKELSFNNYIDLDAAWQIVTALSSGHQGGNSGVKMNYPGASCVVIKHTNPCGAAVGTNALDAFTQAFNADPLSAFGGIIGFSCAVDEAAAAEISKTFFECIIAPEYAPEALELLKKKANLRLLRQNATFMLPYELDYKKVSGGVLVQEKDFGLRPSAGDGAGGGAGGGAGAELQEQRKAVSKRQPTAEELYALEFAWKVSKFVKSNAIVLARGTVTAGIGMGQTSRIDALKGAVQRAQAAFTTDPKALAGRKGGPGGLQLPLVMASDAFFPFRDCVDEAARAGVSAIIQPGGSIRDQESVDAANEHNIALVFTGVRHFRH